MGWIYCIKNCLNEKMYIGQSSVSRIVRGVKSQRFAGKIVEVLE